MEFLIEDEYGKHFKTIYSELKAFNSISVNGVFVGIGPKQDSYKTILTIPFIIDTFSFSAIQSKLAAAFNDKGVKDVAICRSLKDTDIRAISPIGARVEVKAFKPIFKNMNDDGILAKYPDIGVEKEYFKELSNLVGMKTAMSLLTHATVDFEIIPNTFYSIASQRKVNRIDTYMGMNFIIVEE